MNLRLVAFAIATLLAGVAPAGAADLSKTVGLDQLLGAQVPADVTLKDEAGASVRVGQFFGKRPLVLSFVYFDCPMLCNEVLNAELRTLNGLNLNVGKDFDVLTVSIDPNDTPDKARVRKARYLRRYDREGSEAGWHFLTGDAASTRKLAESVGFRYTYSPETRQYTHAAGIMILTPEGKAARYFQGISYPPRDVRLALAEASEGKLGSLSDQMLLFCYQYDPATGRYTLAILNLVRLFCTITAVAVGSYIAFAYRRDRAKTRAAVATGLGPMAP